MERSKEFVHKYLREHFCIVEEKEKFKRFVKRWVDGLLPVAIVLPLIISIILLYGANKVRVIAAFGRYEITQIVLAAVLTGAAGILLGRLFPLYKARVVYVGVWSLFMIMGWKNITAPVLLGLVLCMLTVGLSLKKCSFIWIALVCMIGQVLSFSFVKIYVPFIICFFVFHKMKESLNAGKRSGIIPFLAVLLAGQVLGTVLNGILYQEFFRETAKSALSNLQFTGMVSVTICLTCCCIQEACKYSEISEKKTTSAVLGVCVGAYILFALHNTDVLFFKMAILCLVCHIGYINHFDMSRLLECLKSKKLVSAVIFWSTAAFIGWNLFELDYGRFTISMYFVDYQTFGFVQRGFVGSLFHAILGQDMFIERMEPLLSLVYFASVAICTWLLVKLAYSSEESENEQRTISVILLCAILFSPAFLSYGGENLFRYDLYLLVIALICLILLKGNTRLVWCVPALCLWGMVIHQVFLFILFPVVAVCMVYRSEIDSQGHRIRNRIVLTITMFLIIISFVYFQFFSQQVSNLSVEEALAVVTERSGGYLAAENSLIKHLILEKDISANLAHFHELITAEQVKFALSGLSYQILLFGLYFYAFFAAACSAKNKWNAFLLRVFPLSLCGFLPCYLLEMDYGRWNAHMLLHMLLSLLFLTIAPETGPRWYDKWEPKWKYRYLAIMVVILLISKPYAVFY